MFRSTGRNKALWAIVMAVLWLLAVVLASTPLQAHGGGVPRLTDEVAGPYRIFAWTQPEPLRVGDIHLSIAVVKAAAAKQSERLDEPVTDATVTVTLLPTTSEVAPITVQAVLQEQLGGYYYEADATLPTPGEWRFTIDVSGELGEGSAAFVGAVLVARQLNWLLITAAGLLLCCLLGLIGWWNRVQAKG